MRPAILLAISVALLTPTALADTSSPRAAVDALFTAMRAGNGADIRALVADGAPLARVEPDGAVEQSSFEDWASWVDTQENGDADEQIFAVEVRQSGSLASVWAPFVLIYKGELVGCGVNQFTLAGNDANNWTIVHGIDTQDGGDCATFKERYSAARD